MDLGNLVETAVHHLLIARMTCLGHQDKFSMASELMYVMYTGYDL